MSDSQKSLEPPQFASLSRAITSNGLVRYSELSRDPSSLDQNLAIIAAQNPATADLAFYLNAYNFLTMHKALTKQSKSPNWDGNTSWLSKYVFFVLTKHTVAGTRMNLRYLENSILRDRFKDPRIHFAINCGSWSCPRLAQEPFTAENVDEVLDKLSSSFINDQGAVLYDTRERKLSLNSIFKWYRSDFETHGGGLIVFISRYWKGAKIDPHATIRFQQYEWRLNRSNFA